MLVIHDAFLESHHICIISLVPSVKKINIGNPGIQVNYLGGGGFPH